MGPRCKVALDVHSQNSLRDIYCLCMRVLSCQQFPMSPDILNKEGGGGSGNVSYAAASVASSIFTADVTDGGSTARFLVTD